MHFFMLLNWVILHNQVFVFYNIIEIILIIYSLNELVIGLTTGNNYHRFLKTKCGSQCRQTFLAKRIFTYKYQCRILGVLSLEIKFYAFFHVIELSHSTQSSFCFLQYHWNHPHNIFSKWVGHWFDYR
jgi:hypothetical protein